MPRDYYEVLGVARDASPAEIKKAYRRLARRYHPDVARDDPTAAKHFKEVQTAYDALGDEAKRRAYDQFGPAFEQFAGGGPQAGPGAFRFEGGQVNLDGLGGLSEILGQFMRGGGGGSSRVRFEGGTPFGGPPPGARGQDVEIGLSLSLEEVVAGATRDLTVTVEDACAHCGGRGCGQCGGRGRQRRQQHLRGVKIPPGAEAGSLVKVRGQGGRGPGGEVGDVNLRISLREHPFFRPAGHDLECEVPITLAEAIAGAEIPVPTLSGMRPLKLLPGTGGGQRFRIKGYGLPHGKGREPGNLMVKVQIVAPTAVNDDERRVVEAMCRRQGDPRADLWRPKEG
jgi:DnaJ-class molecular chaperone